MNNQIPTITVGQYDNGNKLVFNLTKDNLVESISGATIKLKFKEKNKKIYCFYLVYNTVPKIPIWLDIVNKTICTIKIKTIKIPM